MVSGMFFIKINFMYSNEVYSFLNKTFTKIAIVFYIFLFLVGYFFSDFKTTMSILGIVLLIYIAFFIKTIKIKKKYKYYKENGIKCDGIIKGTKVEEHEYYDYDDHDYSHVCIIYLIVEYINPYSNEIEKIITERVNGGPFTNLSSLDVSVYVLENGNALVTDFKKIKKLSDSIEYKNNEKYRNNVDFGEKNKIKTIVLSIIFLSLSFINIYLSIILLVIVIILVLSINKK